VWMQLFNEVNSRKLNGECKYHSHHWVYCTIACCLQWAFLFTYTLFQLV
jgi:hypothetical protein